MRKTILFIAIFCLIVFGERLSAQSLGFYHANGQSAIGDTIEFSIDVDSTNQYQEFSKDNIVVIVNESNDTNTYGVKRIEHKIINGTEDYLCWGRTCFSSVSAGAKPVWEPNESTTLEPDDTAGTEAGVYGLKIYFTPYGKVGEVLYEYQVFNINSPFGADNASVFVKYNLSYLTSIAQHNAPNYDFSIYPNPSNTASKINVNLETQGKSEFTLVVKDILGQNITQRKVQSGKNNIQLDMSGQSKGIYFVSLINRNEVLKTKKLIVK